MAVQMVIDGDGHVLEDHDAIASKAPPEWINAGLTTAHLFPELDHVHHALRTRPPGSFMPAAAIWLVRSARSPISSARRASSADISSI